MTRSVLGTTKTHPKLSAYTTLADVGSDVAQLKHSVNTLGAQMTELKIDKENLNKWMNYFLKMLCYEHNLSSLLHII